ncbi:hypothetical protein N9J00_02260 [Acidimicrobiia bacterium]|nr:hypothetical protein [Acidimicrobiia bacterium]
MSCQASGDSVMESSEGVFPSIQGNNLNKQSKTVPDDFVDKDLIVIVAFQQWHQAIVDETIDSLEENGIGDTHNIIEVPTIQKTSKLSEIYLDGIMRAGIRDDRIRNRTITAYINKEEFKDVLGIPDEQTIYWYLIKKGTSVIQKKGYGVISEEEIFEIKELNS